MLVSLPSASDVLCGSATANTTAVITIPGSRRYTCDITISAVQTGAGSARPTVTFTPANGSNGTGPSSATVVASCEVGALVGVASAASTYITGMFHGGSGGATLDFNTGGASAAACSINGFLL